MTPGTARRRLCRLCWAKHRLAQAFSRKLFEEGLFAMAIGYPTVPMGKARIRVMNSAAHSHDDLEQALEIFARVGSRAWRDRSRARMRKQAILITGAGGEVGQALIRDLIAGRGNPSAGAGHQPVAAGHAWRTSTYVQGNLLDTHLLTRLVSEYEIDVIFHLAALLSTRAEITPEMAHHVNVEGTLGLLQAGRGAKPMAQPVDPVHFPQFHRGLWDARPREQASVYARARV